VIRFSATRTLPRSLLVVSLRRPGRAAGSIVRGALLGVLLASLIVSVLGSQMAGLMLDGARARALDQLQIGVLGQLRAADFAPPYTTSGLDDLSARLDPLVAPVLSRGSELIRVNVLGLDGTILFPTIQAFAAQ
jgi:hypothetical protein